MPTPNQRIKEERLKRKWTKKTFAKLIGVSVKTVTRIETDNASFKAKYLIAISKAFDLDYDYLLCFSDFKAKRNK